MKDRELVLYSDKFNEIISLTFGNRRHFVYSNPKFEKLLIRKAFKPEWQGFINLCDWIFLGDL